MLNSERAEEFTLLGINELEKGGEGGIDLESSKRKLEVKAWEKNLASVKGKIAFVPSENIRGLKKKKQS